MPLSATELEVLGSADLFQGLSPAARASIWASAALRQVPPGSVILNQGDEPSQVYVLVSGGVKLGHLTPNGGTIALEYCGPGDVVGCVAVLRPMPYPVTATAIETSVLIGWSAAQIEACFEEHPMLLRNMARIICARVDDLLQRLRELVTEPVEQRVARTLQRVLPVFEGARRAGETALPLSRQDIAELTGSTHFTVSRVMSAWEQQGIIESRRQRVIVRNAPRLASIAEGAC